MAEQLEFDPAMFGMKSNHGMLRSSAPKSQGSGANAVSVSSTEASASSGGQNAGFEQSCNNRGGPRGGFNRGRGGNRGGRGGGRGASNAGQRSNDGQPFKRQRFDGDAPNRGGPRGFFKPSMLEDPWNHLS